MLWKTWDVGTRGWSFLSILVRPFSLGMMLMKVPSDVAGWYEGLGKEMLQGKLDFTWMRGTEGYPEVWIN